MWCRQKHRTRCWSACPVSTGVTGDRAASVEAAVSDVELVSLHGAAPVAGGGGRLERAVPGQPGHRGERVGGPAEQALEIVPDGGGDVAGQPDADEVGEEGAVGLAQIDGSDLPAGQHAHRCRHIQRDALWGARTVSCPLTRIRE